MLRVAGKPFDDILLVLRPQDHDVRLAGLPVTVIAMGVDAFGGVADGLGAGRLGERNGER
ncbi:MAG: hypothetical protein OXI88_00440 [Gammaproteobacteria bacterium]|nr:hypothetical protein [Gammaproteobacteria bacterium]MDE0510248.1 hypothetical protein [Gammaproteobacteria bacterium]